MKSLLSKNKWKVVNAVFLLISVFLFIAIRWYWNYVCIGGDCSYKFMAGTLSPLKNTGLILSPIFLLFIFLPQTYFRNYFLHWFWWLFLIFYTLTRASEPVNGNIVGFDREQVVLILGVIGIVHALLFVFLHYRKRKQKTRT